MVEDLGPYSIIHLKINEETTIRVIEKSLSRRERGEKVRISIDTNKVVLFDASSERNLLEQYEKVKKK